MADLGKLQRIFRDLKAPEYFLRQYPGLAAKLTAALEKAPATGRRERVKGA